MIRRILPACAVLLTAACTDARTPLDPENPAPESLPALQGLSCAVDLAQGGMTCDDAAPQTGSALGSAGVIVGGQNQLVRLASSGVAAVGDTILVDVTIQNLIPQALGTTDGATEDGRGVRIFFSDGPTAHPQGTAWVANADGEGFFLAGGQPYFQYDTILGQNETSAPRTWKLAHTPGATRVTFTVYVAAQVQREGERIVMTSPLNTFVLPGDTVTLGARVEDFAGRPVPGRAITWRTTEPDIVSVDQNGHVKALRMGWAMVHAESGGLSTGSAVVVVSRETVVRVDVEPDSATVDMNGLVQLTATAYNVRGERIDETLQYSDGNIWVAVVNWNTGLVRGTYPGQTSISVGRDWGSARAVITTRPGPEVQWRNVSTAQGHTCGVSTAGKGYCWGHNGIGQLGWGQIWNYGEDVPVGVAGNLSFTTIDGGNWFTCGLAGRRAYCWGESYHGQLGNGMQGSTDGVPSPQAVLGGHAFTALSAGFEHACALDEDGAAWCWGNNAYGQLGNGEIDGVTGRSSPVRVAGGLTFRHISAGRDYTCAITPGDEMYCWGSNQVGQFGNGAGAPALNVPQPVPGGVGHKWKTVATGDSHVCAVTVKGEAFCWGADYFGELGTGVAEASTDLPAKVLSHETFVDIGVGTNHSCAVAEDGRAWCWGFDRYGQLGRGQKGSIDPYPVPEPVMGDARFTGSVQGGYQHTCAMGTDGKPYCWGTDFHGEGGIQPDTEFCTVPGGTAPCHTRPRPVSNPAAGGVRTGPTTGTTTAPSVVQARAAITAPLTMRFPRR
ncbi:hypothetical protein [Longimicrobium sp.]|uniref:RCC1 domain-containing protein n=1 Tax=Longimicrobium sp. TaxID=2029185 RepID=UPI002E3743A2|nr:hypothetical protein [Longimicrobium sp.]HEX6036913.1 hypothetical protein [Longimicrobium sp.]